MRRQYDYHYSKVNVNVYISPPATKLRRLSFYRYLSAHREVCLVPVGKTVPGGVCSQGVVSASGEVSASQGECTAPGRGLVRGWVGIPACTEDNPRERRLLLRTVRISKWKCIYMLLTIILSVTLHEADCRRIGTMALLAFIGKKDVSGVWLWIFEWAIVNKLNKLIHDDDKTFAMDTKIDSSTVYTWDSKSLHLSYNIHTCFPIIASNEWGDSVTGQILCFGVNF